jgi:hypothetical protein
MRVSNMAKSQASKANSKADKNTSSKASKPAQASKANKVATGKSETVAQVVADHSFAIREQQAKLKLLAATKGKLVVSTVSDEGEADTTTIAIDAVCPASIEKPTYDVLNGRLTSRTQVIHSILIDAAKRGVVMTTKAIQESLESYLGIGHGAAYAHLNTLLGKGDNLSHPCKITPYVVHDESVTWGWGLSLEACRLAGIGKTDLPFWVSLPKGGKYNPEKVKSVKVLPEKKSKK